MNPPTLWGTFTGWIAHLPVALAYRLVWFVARFNLGAGRDVYAAMWDANLALPPLPPKPQIAPEMEPIPDSEEGS